MANGLYHNFIHMGSSQESPNRSERWEHWWSHVPWVDWKCCETLWTSIKMSISETWGTNGLSWQFSRSGGSIIWSQLNHIPVESIQWEFQDPKMEVPTIYKAYVREYHHKIWPYMVQYLHFRILEFPIVNCFCRCPQDVSFLSSLGREKRLLSCMIQQNQTGRGAKLSIGGWWG